ncbi:MAG TPA: winged helix DNA-binding domain-containing protein [Actinomycetales bacterium]|nr:winged helix DNA-binding domain-containing protein [Actinomycetales bacterium]
MTRGAPNAGSISRRGLNRATLSRQLLLQRSDLSVPEVVEHLVGLQAQTPHSWYVGLWARLEEFDPHVVSARLEARELVRLALMRSTIHLVTAADAVTLRRHVEPVLERVVSSGPVVRGLAGLHVEEVLEAARHVLVDRPMTLGEIGRHLAERFPAADPTALAHVVRAGEALVQVTPRGTWRRSGKAAHTTIGAWLGHDAVAATPVHDIDRFVLRYLKAFGPATVRDAQNWSGLTRLGEVFDRLSDQLVVLTDTDPDAEGRQLYDLPDAPRPDADTPAPARLLYDYDNLLRSHEDRSRVVTDVFRKRAWAPNGIPPQPLLLDGATAGSWALTSGAPRAVLTIETFEPLDSGQEEDVTTEALALLDLLAADAEERDIRFVLA